MSIIIDDRCFRLGFAPCQDGDGKSLPLLYVSPPLCWRNILVHPLLLNQPSILLLSTLHLLDIARLQMNKFDTVVGEVQSKLYDIPYSPPISSIPTRSLAELLQTLEEKDEELEKKDHELEEKSKKLEENGKKLEELEEANKKLEEELKKKSNELQSQVDELREIVSPRKVRKIEN